MDADEDEAFRSRERATALLTLSGLTSNPSIFLSTRFPLSPYTSSKALEVGDITEVDRMWTVTPSISAQPITYVLECKWGLVRKRNVDDFFEVLRWSKMCMSLRECLRLEGKVFESGS